MPGERVNIKSFTALMERLADTPEGQAEQLAVEFLAKVNARMRALGMDNKALAQRHMLKPGMGQQMGAYRPGGKRPRPKAR